ncbi:hypothetical protein ACVRZD_00350 [Streptococcus hongkongensis]|nr:hypothetical protein NC01_00355 [Streptococcus uberis]
MKKRFFVSLSVSLLLFMVLIYVNQLPPKVVMSNGTNTNPAAYSEKQFKKLLKKHYPEVTETLVAGTDQPFYVIPGLKKTLSFVHGGADKGKLKTATDMDPQGLSIVEDKYMLISAYSKSKTYNSVIWVIDIDTGTYLKTLCLDDIDHVGALTYDDDHDKLWVSTINNKNQAQIESLSLHDIESYDVNQTKRPIQFREKIDIVGIKLASYMTYYKNTLYVGYFNKAQSGKLAEIPISSLQFQANTIATVKPRKIYETIPRVQGISFFEDNILLSQSFGTKNSKLYIFKNKLSDNTSELGSDNAISSITLPPYLEQIVGRNDLVYLIFESASPTYMKKNVIHMDRVIKISIESKNKK